MAESDEIDFACIGCGTLNPTTAETCAGCGHRFRGEEITSSSPGPPLRWLPSTPTPWHLAYTPRPGPKVPPRLMHINVLMCMVLVVAICLTAFASGVPAGIFWTSVLLPPAIRVWVLSYANELRGRTIGVWEHVRNFMVGLLLAFAFVVASSVAFAICCIVSLPTTSFKNEAPVIIGGIGALVVWSFLNWLTIWSARQGVLGPSYDDPRYRG